MLPLISVKEVSEQEAVEMEKLFEYLEKEHSNVKYNKQVMSHLPPTNLSMHNENKLNSRFRDHSSVRV